MNYIGFWGFSSLSAILSGYTRDWSYLHNFISNKQLKIITVLIFKLDGIFIHLNLAIASTMRASNKWTISVVKAALELLNNNVNNAL